MISAVLFDLEGTLVDFQWKLEEAEEALRQALSPLGFEPELFVGADYAAIRHRALDRANSPELAAEVDCRLAPIYDHYDQDALQRWNLRDGAAALIHALSARDMPLAVVSNIGRRAGQAVLEKFALRTSLRLVISREDVARMKPSGEGIRRAMEQLGVAPQDTVMVGDSLTDLRAARDAGVRVALLEGGETQYRGLGDEVPDYGLSSLAEVMDLVFADG